MCMVALRGQQACVQWYLEKWTQSGPTSSVLIIEVSLIQGLELFIIKMTI